ncbi:MAG: HAD-IIIA family hydrolase [Syntrophobacterales bacterium]|nr:HAD-IIIA family hydrolase [Syntrophobacterales bacterium]
MKTLICIDRDGTIIHDTRDHLFLGKDDDWRSQVRILPHVVEGLKRLNALSSSAIHMITNQPGVAILDYPLLTEDRAHEVCSHVIETLRKCGVKISGYFLCPHANPVYVERHPEFTYDQNLVHDCHCMKPSLGMVFNALKANKLTLENVNLYVIGDRATDVQTALSAGGIGILIPFANEPGEDEKVVAFAKPGRVFIAGNMEEAADFIVGRGS